MYVYKKMNACVLQNELTTMLNNFFQWFLCKLANYTLLIHLLNYMDCAISLGGPRPAPPYGLLLRKPKVLTINPTNLRKSLEEGGGVGVVTEIGVGK
jgi:hypothetical protein